MKKFFAMLLLSNIMFVSYSANALEWECDDMKDFVDNLYEAGKILNKSDDFDEYPEVEKSIDELMGVLNVIAKDEDIDAFTDAVDEMQNVWQKEVWKGDDIGDFRRAMDSVTLNLERIHDKYCDN